MLALWKSKLRSRCHSLKSKVVCENVTESMNQGIGNIGAGRLIPSAKADVSDETEFELSMEGGAQQSQPCKMALPHGVKGMSLRWRGRSQGAGRKGAGSENGWGTAEGCHLC